MSEMVDGKNSSLYIFVEYFVVINFEYLFGSKC